MGALVGNHTCLCLFYSSGGPFTSLRVLVTFRGCLGLRLPLCWASAVPGGGHWGGPHCTFEREMATQGLSSCTWFRSGVPGPEDMSHVGALVAQNPSGGLGRGIWDGWTLTHQAGGLLVSLSAPQHRAWPGPQSRAGKCLCDLGVSGLRRALSR